MPTPDPTAEPVAADQRPAADTLPLVRTPVFDAGNRCVACTLRAVGVREVRSGPPPAGSVGASLAAQADARRLHAVGAIGLDRLAGGHLALVEIGRAALLEGLHQVLPADAVMLLIDASCAPDAALLDAVAAARDDGYRMALDGWRAASPWRAHLGLAAAVRCAMTDADDADLAAALAACGDADVERHAFGIDTGRDRLRAARLGFTHVEGAFFASPSVIDGRAIPLGEATTVRLLGLVADPDVRDGDLEAAFRSHPALSLSLLRLVSSAQVGARGVESIPQAIRLVGRRALTRWLLVQLTADAGRRGPLAHEAVLAVLARARFSELVAERTGGGEPSVRFLLGLLSRLDALLGEPMPRVLERLPVSGEVRDALLYGVGPHASALAFADAWEAGTLPEGVVGDGLGEAYAEAVAWARERLGPPPNGTSAEAAA